MYTEKSVRVSFVGAGDVLQHIVCAKESKYGMLVVFSYPKEHVGTVPKIGMNLRYRFTLQPPP